MSEPAGILSSVLPAPVFQTLFCFYGKEVRFSIYLAFHFIHYYNVLSCIKEQNLFTFVVNCIFKWSWNKLINANHIKKT